MKIFLYILIFLTNSIFAGGPYKFLYRGSNQSFESVFREGFKSRGSNDSIINHCSSISGKDSIFISSSSEYKIAKKFAERGDEDYFKKHNKYNKYSYIYVILPRNDAWSVRNVIENEIIKFNKNQMPYNSFSREQKTKISDDLDFCSRLLWEEEWVFKKHIPADQVYKAISVDTETGEELSTKINPQYKDRSPIWNDMLYPVDYSYCMPARATSRLPSPVRPAVPALRGRADGAIDRGTPDGMEREEPDGAESCLAN